MKICICTTPIRPTPTDFPPFGSLAIIQSLRHIGESPEFFNIDYFRHSLADVRRYFQERQFDVVGISAVVSTAYAYTKKLVAIIKEVSPDTVVVVGGNLAASAEILLRRCRVDFCVVGDGELIVRRLVEVLRQKPRDYERLGTIKGICFLEPSGSFRFTGYGEKPTADQIESPDYRILSADSSISYFISDEIAQRTYADPGTITQGKRVACVVMTKGCVARCTFCHRWERGFRALPVDRIIDHVRDLARDYNVGFINVSDENFGSDRRAAGAIAENLGNLGMKWQVAGVRAKTVTKESLNLWKANGCVCVIYGIESGSQKMLDVMEKNTTVEENVNALRWAGEADLNTVVQLVLGMPGETDATIEETIDFLIRVSPFVKAWRGRVATGLLSINYAQALPGTPLYEFARERGIIGNSIDEEEQYLIRISDTDAYKEDHFINHTGLPLLKVLMWRPYIIARLDAHHYRQLEHAGASMSLTSIAAYYFRHIQKRMRRGAGVKKDYVTDSGYFNIQSGFRFAPLLLNPITQLMFFPLLAIATSIKAANSPITAIRLLTEYTWSAVIREKSDRDVPPQSLRKTVNIVPSSTETDDQMLPLRAGR